MKHVTIYSENNRYCSFPHIAKLPNGNLAVVFRKAGKFSADAAKNGIPTHHDADSSIEMIESTDGGLTWPLETHRTIYKSEFGVNDPALTILQDGSILCRFVALRVLPTAQAAQLSGNIFSHRVEHGLVTTVVGNLVIKSKDQGKTWYEVGLGETLALKNSCSRDPIVEMPDGSLLMPVYTGGPQRTDICWVIRSFNQGVTWTEETRIAIDPQGGHSQHHGISYNETSLLHLGNGELLAMIRADQSVHTEDEFVHVGGVGSIFTSRSYDGGLCWTPVTQTVLWGQPCSVISLSNGNLLATFGYRKKPYGIRCCLSRDRGKTWLANEQVIVREGAPTWDLGYPFSIELDNGRILTVYYYNDSDGNRFVAGTHWDL